MPNKSTRWLLLYRPDFPWVHVLTSSSLWKCSKPRFSLSAWTVDAYKIQIIKKNNYDILFFFNQDDDSICLFWDFTSPEEYSFILQDNLRKKGENINHFILKFIFWTHFCRDCSLTSSCTYNTLLILEFWSFFSSVFILQRSKEHLVG